MTTSNCGACGDVLPARPPSMIRDHMFCSQACYSASDFRAVLTRETVRKSRPRGRVAVVCDSCNTEFTKQRNQVRGLNFCDRDCFNTHKRSQNIRQINSLGYVLLFIGKGEPGATKSGHILEHRLVMQRLLGRPLVGDENVHHRNGVRDDNRIENLELWTTSQPLGQRVEDQIAWAREILTRYGEGIVR